MKNNDYIVFTLHDNDFCNDFTCVAELLSYLITHQDILNNKNVDLEVIREYFIDTSIRNYRLLRLGKSGYSSAEDISDYFKKQLKVYCISKEDVVYDNSEILYICINDKMREFGEFFII